MLTIKQIADNPDFIIERLSVRNLNVKEIVAEILDLDSQKRQTQKQSDELKAELNQLSKQFGQLKAQGKIDEAEKNKERTAELKIIEKELSIKFESLDIEIQQKIIQLPNLPHVSVPKGKSAEDNQIVRSGGEMPKFDFEAMPHWELAKKFDLIDFELGVKITGAGFPVYKGKGAKLQRALINFFLEEAEKAGYTEFEPPFMVNSDSGYGTGQLPDKEGQMYHCTIDNLYLVPTAEVPVTNFYRDMIIDADDLPIKNTAYTPCFRREAGSYGKDVRGLNRLHQFDKVEIVQVQHPDKSYLALEDMVNHVESLVKKLELPYRIVKLCGGDMGFTSALTYDFEVYSAAQDKWLEVSSVSNFETFQANRLKLRFKEKGEKKTQLAHTLNGSALALPRILASILEDYQTKDGIKIPKALIPFTKFDTIS